MGADAAKGRAKEEAPGVVVQAPFFRSRGKAVGLSRTPTAAPAKAAPRPLHVARTLALAHEIVRLIDEGTFADQAHAARALGFTRARITQLVDLTLLAPQIQEEILDAETVSGRDASTERALRAVSRMASWAKQRCMWTEIRNRCAGVRASLVTTRNGC